MDIKYHVEAAWKLCLANALSLILITLVAAAVSVVSLGILAPVAFAGYSHSLLQLLRVNREPKVQDVFSELRLFLPLFAFTLIVFIVSLIGFTILVVPGIVFTLIVGYTCLYMIPLMVDKKFGLLDAVKKSAALVTGSHMMDHLIVFILFFALTAIGGSSFIGFILLQPFATLFLLSVYEKTE